MSFGVGIHSYKDIKVCFCQKQSFCQPMDFAKSHLEDLIDSFKCYKTECKIIDRGVTPLIQFIDTYVSKPLKHLLRDTNILKCRWNSRVHQARQPST